MKKKLTELSQFLNEQTKRNTPMAFFYTGFTTVTIFLLLYVLWKLIPSVLIIRPILFGILFYFVISALGAIVIGLLDAFFNK